MGYGKISAKQQEILDYIKEEILKDVYKRQGQAAVEKC